MQEREGANGLTRIFIATIACGVTLLASGAAAADGRTIYAQVCAACHTMGVAGAPKLGDRADWARRLAAGRSAMIVSVLRGKGQMPPKGGNVSLSDDDAKAAVDYMLERVK